MKKQLLLCLSLFLLSVGAFSQMTEKDRFTNKYTRQWSEIYELETDDLPKSAAIIVEHILQKAIIENNSPQVIKGLIYRNKYKTIVDSQNNTELISDLESYLERCTDVADKSLLHSMLAQLYLDYYDLNRWGIDKRGEIKGFIPTDIKEWSKNIFKDNILQNLAMSVQNQAFLLKEKANFYQDIIELGEDSRRLYPTLYDFLISRAIELSERITQDEYQTKSFQRALFANNIQMSDLALGTNDFIELNFSGDDELVTLEYYKCFLKSLLERNLDESVVLIELKRNNYLSLKSNEYQFKYALDFLFALEKKNEEVEYNVEIISTIIDNLNNNRNISPYRNIDLPTKDNSNEIYDWCKYGLKKYPVYRRINLLKSHLSSLENPFATVSGPSVYHPNNKNKTFKLKYKNLRELTIQIRDKNTKAIIKTEKIILNIKTTYSAEEKDFTIDLNTPGNYEVLAIFDKETSNSAKEEWFSFSISPLASFSRVAGQNKYEFYVVDRITGKPIKDASVLIYVESRDLDECIKLDEVKTNNDGLAIYDLNERLEADTTIEKYYYRYRISKDGIELPFFQNFLFDFGSNSNFSDEVVNIFTDRSIYRPGQTVYFKAISTSKLSEEITTLNINKAYNAILYDVNNQVVESKILLTNEFGSIASDFILPQKGLLGEYRIDVGESSRYFNVEEYKRPTFQVTFDKIDKAYAFGDVVRIVGRAESYSGSKVQGANVEYDITRCSVFGSNYPSPSETVDNGTIITKDDGSFEIIFLVPTTTDSYSTKLCDNRIHNFSVNARVTDINGETQTENFDFVIGDTSLILSTNISVQIDKNSKDKIIITTTDLNGKYIQSKVNYTIYTVLANDSINQEVSSGSFITDTTCFDLKKVLEKLPSAKYLISLFTKDEKGRDVISRNYFVLYSLEDKKPPIETNAWLIEKGTSFNSSIPAEIILGISSSNSIVLYDLLKGDQILKRQRVKFSDENKKFVIPYKDEYGKQITAVFTYVIDEVPYRLQVPINKIEEDKKLNLKFKVFRDKLRPGQQEEWMISVKDNYNKAVFAELLVSMYDSSLDQLTSSHVWMYDPHYDGYIYSKRFEIDASFQRVRGYRSFLYDNFESRPFIWDELNWFGFNFSRNIIHSTFSKLNSNLDSFTLGAGAGVIDIPDLKNHKIILEEIDSSKDNTTRSGIQIRSNFKETAFFYPQLKTDRNGESIFSFTVPESNTTWRVRVLAYDKSLNIGEIDTLVVSRKELMVTPNLPRFVREGDNTSISAKIINLSDKLIDGKVRIELFDPLTDTICSITIINQFQNYTLEKGGSKTVTWNFDIPSDVNMLGCRIVADSELFSDGEQHVISVLPNRMLVTETMPLNINGFQNKKFKFDKLINNKSKTLTNYSLTLEYSDNPTWYALQALPTLSSPTADENVINLFASYYVNTLGAYILKQYPQIETMIEAWKNRNVVTETLSSRLQQNEELKTVLLEETPWILDAKNETEQMNRLSSLFDVKNMNMQTKQAISKLQDLQNLDGGWSWYKGMYSSRSLTQYILYGFSQLVNLNAVEYPYEVRMMQIKALKYIDNELLNDYSLLKESNENLDEIKNISTDQLEYLYVRSSYRDIPIGYNTREAERFYTSIAVQYWTSLNLYERSLLAILLYHDGKKELSTKIMNSVRQYATITDEMGMFWNNNTNKSFMSNSAVAIHSFILKVFQEIDSKPKEIDLMKQWLLKQKQVQTWESSHTTIDAIYALLSTGSDWLTKVDSSKVYVANKLIDSSNKEFATGYIKQSWTGNEIVPSMGNVSIENEGEASAWGAMYFQYYDKIDNISSQKGVLNVDKGLFIERVTNDGKFLLEVSESNPLKIGDKVVIRLVVRIDRDMEFVHLKDMRASCLEPIERLSGFKWQNNVSYYQSIKDASTNLYFDRLARGTYVFEYSVYVTRNGICSNGVTTIQSVYAPQFISNTEGTLIRVQ